MDRFSIAKGDPLPPPTVRELALPLHTRERRFSVCMQVVVPVPDDDLTDDELARIIVLRVRQEVRSSLGLKPTEYHDEHGRMIDEHGHLITPNVYAGVTGIINSPVWTTTYGGSAQ